MRSPFRYPGGKFYAIRFLRTIWAGVEHDEYREPFVGGGQVFFAKSKTQYNWLNDVFEDLMNTYVVIQDNDLRRKLIALLVKERASKERHSEMKGWMPTTSLERAYRFYYLNRTSYSGIMNKPAWGYAPGNSAPPSSWGTLIDAAGEKLDGVRLTSFDFESIIDAPPLGRRVFVYLDPPYVEADQTRAYTHPFTMKDHERLAAALRRTKHQFLLSYDDCQTARKLYSWANLQTEEWWYNTANVRSVSRKKGRELLVTNF